MPPVTSIPSEDRPKSSAFTVLDSSQEDIENKNNDIIISEAKIQQKNINIVKPIQRINDEARGNHLNSAHKEIMVEKMTEPIPQTILDPKFSRALEFKLRRLKEKETLQENLRRPVRKKRNALTVSNPNISDRDKTPEKKMSQSHPRIDTIVPEDDSVVTKISPNTNKSPSPGRKSRNRRELHSENEKPRFITTVKTGQFLLPPPELACLLGLETLYPPEEREKIVYSYASKPKAVASRMKRSSNSDKENQKPETQKVVERKRHPGDLFSGVRALVAGVIGMKHMVEEKSGVNGCVIAPYNNLMHDKRVVRGSTLAHPNAAGDNPMAAAAVRAARQRKRALLRRQAQQRMRPGTPPPAPGRRHHPIQTEKYLEELFDKGEQIDRSLQTDLFVDRPATPLYVPAKTGADAYTQIYPGDLFDFDLEVQPILEALVGKTTEQALAEVAQEEELATLREHQRRFIELRDAERAERERLAAQDERLHWEKERRVAEARQAKVAAVEARERAAAAVLVRGYVAELLPSVLAGLREEGYLIEHINKGVEDEFLPWLEKEVSAEIETIVTSRDVIAEIVREVVETRHREYRARHELEARRPPPEESVTPTSLQHTIGAYFEGEGEELLATAPPSPLPVGTGVVK